MEAIKKQNNILFSMAKRLDSCRELKNIRNKESNKLIHFIRNIASSDSEFSLSSDTY